MTKSNRTCSAYLVTWSDEPAMPVGNILIDKGILLERTWDVLNFKTGKSTSAVGVRLARLCATCRNKHSRIGLADHAGEHGSDEVKQQASDFLAAEKRQRQAVSA